LLDEIPSVWEAEYVLDAAVGKSSVDPDNVGLVGRVRLARTACDDAAIGDDRSCRRACASPRLMHESFLHQFAGARIDGKDLASTACLI
jgi:hypothetical protein